MKKALFLAAVLILCGVASGEEGKVFTDDDLKGYSSKPMADPEIAEQSRRQNDMEVTRARHERMNEITRKMILILSDIKMTKQDQCRQLLEFQREYDNLMENETDIQRIGNNAKSKVHIESDCLNYN